MFWLSQFMTSASDLLLGQSDINPTMEYLGYSRLLWIQRFAHCESFIMNGHENMRLFNNKAKRLIRRRGKLLAADRAYKYREIVHVGDGTARYVF
jgi:hypothetical protein